jgi:hypothetical protein
MIEHDDFYVVPYVDMENIVETLKNLKQTSHYECDDWWYSCPMAENYFGHDDRNFCSCGLEQTNKNIDAILELLKK